ncbi:hypothetical protein GCM10009843_33040 [Nocardioides bigeumensis]|uniref:Serine hydroxymethyltransferase-like domain-containing protein n=1 Tax=Nocardioides bigeumensis TaxID=433657 RepID=A0ABP5KCG2_9ACTN
MTVNVLESPLAQFDPEIDAAIADELRRQQSTLEMIASENFAPLSVMEAQGSVLTNKYAEGYPGRRYYGGCEFIDLIERLAQDRVKELFGATYANVQPHSGATANAAAMMALLSAGDTILGLDLAHGGHLSHGMRQNFSLWVVPLLCLLGGVGLCMAAAAIDRSAGTPPRAALGNGHDHCGADGAEHDRHVPGHSAHPGPDRCHGGRTAGDGTVLTPDRRCAAATDQASSPTASSRPPWSTRYWRSRRSTM